MSARAPDARHSIITPDNSTNIFFMIFSLRSVDYFFAFASELL